MQSNTIEQVISAFTTYLQDTLDISPDIVRTCSISINTDTKRGEFGDINSNAPLVLAKRLGYAPIELAQSIADQFTHSDVEYVEAAKPGFINITLTQEAIQRLSCEIYQNGNAFFTTPASAEAPNYNLEYVSANPTGPLHFGHGRGGIIGDVLSRILQFNQYNTTREYYINDAGQQMHKLGMSLYYRCRQQLGEHLEMPEDAYHGDYLVNLAQQLINEYGNQVVNNTYQFFANYAQTHLLAHIRETLDQYRVAYDVWFSEQTLHDNNKVTEAVQALANAGYTYESDGALWFRSTDFGDDKDRVLQRHNGEYTYMAADVAYLQNKFQRGFTKLIMILGQDHHSYVDRLHAAAQALGHGPDHLYIILYQMVSLTSGGEQVRMSKRTGKIVTLNDIIDMVGTDAARYFYLNKKADAHLEFDIELAQKQSDENPVFYIQYAYVRTKSILDKAAEHSELANICQSDLTHIGEAERGIIRKIASLKSLLTNIQQNYQTHLLAHYVYDIAHAFHSYYGANKVILPEDPQTSRMRLALVQLVRTTLTTGLNLLGLSAPDQM